MMLRPSPLKKRRDRGFTLVELSVVVTIVGILSVLAVVGYRRLMTSSHLSEATGMVNSIRVAQEAIHAETGSYASPSATLGWPSGTSVAGELCPLATPAASKTGWNPACGGGSKWSSLPVHVDGPVAYGYASICGGGGCPNSGTTITFPTGSPLSGTAASGEWYTISAVGDSDGDGTYSGVIGSSATNDLYIQGDGN